MTDRETPRTTACGDDRGTVAPGCRVTVRDSEGEHEHTIVARVTAAAPLSCVSVASPVGRALLGRCSGEVVEVHTPGGTRLLTIVGVDAAAMSSGSGPAREG